MTLSANNLGMKFSQPNFTAATYAPPPLAFTDFFDWAQPETVEDVIDIQETRALYESADIEAFVRVR